MALAAWILRPLYGISKLAATPSWCLWSSIITCLMWAGLYWIIDVRGWNRMPVPFRFVGTNALFAYLLGSLCYYAISISGFDYYFSLNHRGFFPGFARSVIFTMLIGAISGWVGHRGLRLKL